ncbi:hypothetical protein QQM79_11595 [Marinobacteraceae bacterium S3BR75-40.1]
MKRWLASHIGIVFGTLAAPLWALTPQQFSGTAYAMDDNRKLYQEEHTIEGRCDMGTLIPRNHRVTYRSPDGKQFALKTLDYAISPQRPSFEKTDERFQERMQVTNKADRVAQISWDGPGNSPIQRFEVNLGKQTVIDAGFDAFLRTHLGALREGSVLSFEFLGPTRGETFPFEAQQIDPPGNLEGTVAIRIRPASFLARFFVDPIILGYSAQGLLTDYMGLTNIRRDNDSFYQAHIRYQHPNPPCR